MAMLKGINLDDYQSSTKPGETAPDIVETPIYDFKTGDSFGIGAGLGYQSED